MRTIAGLWGCVVILGLCAPVGAREWLAIGGNGQLGDCQAEFKVMLGEPTLSHKSHWKLDKMQTCTDGDPACDADGCVNNRCLIQMSMCYWVDDPAISLSNHADCEDRRAAIFHRTDEFAGSAIDDGIYYYFSEPRYTPTQSLPPASRTRDKRLCANVNLDNLKAALDGVGSVNVTNSAISRGYPIVLLDHSVGATSQFSDFRDTTWTNHNAYSSYPTGCTATSCDPFPEYTISSAQDCCTVPDDSECDGSSPATDEWCVASPSSCSPPADLYIPIPPGARKGTLRFRAHFQSEQTLGEAADDVDEGGGDRLVITCARSCGADGICDTADDGIPPQNNSCSVPSEFANRCCPCRPEPTGGNDPDCSLTCP